MFVFGMPILRGWAPFLCLLPLHTEALIEAEQLPRPMAKQNNQEEERIRAGLCAECAHARRVNSDRGATFWLCELSATDTRFPRYPRLPVVKCVGFMSTSMGSG